MGGIQSRGDSEFDILGDVWLKSVYVVCQCQTVHLRKEYSHADRDLTVNQGEKKVGVGQRND